MKKGRDPRRDGSSGNEPKQPKATGSGTTATGGKLRAPTSTRNNRPFQLSAGGKKQQQQNTSSSSTSNHPWSRSHPNGGSGVQQQIGDRNNQRPQYPIGWAIIEKINEQVKNKELLEGSNDLLAAMDTDAVHMRMNDIWRELEKQEAFVHLIVLTARAIHAGIHQLTQTFLRRTLNSKLVDHLVKDHILQLRPQRSANIVKSLAELLLLGWTTFPTLMAEKHAQNTEYVILKVNQQKTQQFPSTELDELLKKLDVVMKGVLARQNANAGLTEREGSGGNRNRQQNRNNESTGPPPEDFRTMDVQLSEDDILTQNEAVYLRKAIIQGPYTDDEHYLDVQFRLLREDLCRPLRAGIHEFRAAQNNNNHHHNRGRNSLLVYRDVRFAGIELHRQDGKILAYLRLSPRDQRRRMQRRFIFGSLVCLSSDGFDNSFIFGTIVDRDGISGGGGNGRNKRKFPDQKNGRQFEIEKSGTIGILLQSMTTAVPQLREGTAYWLVESPAFYECYSHVLRALQSIRLGQPVPFSNYLVRMHQNPSLPRYQRNNNGPHQQQAHPLDFGSLLVNIGHQAMMQCPSTQLTAQFTADQFGMDQSQFEAFAYALRSEVAVIQGPPGTGKTFLGLKVVRLLFANQRLWTTTSAAEAENTEEGEGDLAQRRLQLQRARLGLLNNNRDGQRPMLIVCYTNHALDQFLEGIHTFVHDGIVRVGSQSKNEALEKFNLRYLQNDRNGHVSGVHRHRIWKCRDELKNLGTRMEEMKKHLFGTKQNPAWIVPYAQLFPQEEPLNNQEQRHAFDTVLKRRYRDFFNNNYKFTAWLTIAKPSGSTAERFDIYTKTWSLVRDFNVPEELANLACLYCLSTNDFQMLAALVDSEMQPASLQRLRLKLQKSGRELEFRAKVRTWPALAEVDSLLEIGLDAQVAVELLHSIKRDGQYAENLRQLRQHRFGRRQQLSAHPHPPVTAAVVNDFEAMELNGEDQYDDDYDDPENEARMFDDGGDDLFFDFLVEREAERIEHNFENSADLRKCLAKISTPMSDAESQQMANVQTDPWDLPLLTRWCLYKRWVQQWEPNGERVHNKLISDYCAKRRELDELRSLADIEIMRHAKVIGMTTTKAAHLQSALRSVKPRIVVVEEAAEVFEQHIVTALTECCEHLILIGDHQQLRPSPEDYQLGKQYHLDISLFERLVMNGFDYRQLSTQHRMRPEISATMMGHFYTNLQDHSSVRQYPSVMGLQKNLFFVTHSEPESSNKDDARSHANHFEAEFAVQFAKYLYKQGYKGSQITILCTYSDQFFDIRQRMGKCFGENKNHGIRVANVDNYQGEECDIIILSLVRSNNPQNRIGFLNTANRVCVAMSRAKHGFYIFGNMEFLAQYCNSKSPTGSYDNTNLWASIRQSLIDAESIGPALPIVCQLHGKAQEISSANQFDQLAPEGGCAQPCGIRLDCGHTCRKPCHAFDTEHKETQCVEKCARKCPEELHGCNKLCYQECDPCSELVPRQLSCDHYRMAQCHLKVAQLKCKEPCPKLLPCGHPCVNKCSQTCTPNCQVPMERTLPCGHTMTLQCFKDPLLQQCQQVVQKRWPICQHVSSAKCYQDPAILPCTKPCGVPLADCEHPCKGTCGQCRQGRLHRDCAEDCKRILICGHECRSSKCAKDCPPCSRPCESECIHNKCCMKGKDGKSLGKKCGERCTPCAEQCANKCYHQRCTKLCYEPCDIDPCVHPCRKLLPCSISGPKPTKGTADINTFQIVHPCIGVCGEECLKICAICDPERLAEIKEIFFGTEDEEDARFVQLQDCWHIFEATGLDKAIQIQLESQDGGDNAAIVVIKCPKCSTPIRKSNRYTKLLNERAMQIDKVKKKMLGDKTKEQLLAEWDNLKQILMERELSMPAVAVHEKMNILHAFEKIRQSILNVQKHEITGQWIAMAENIDKLLLGFSQTAKRISDSYGILQVVINTTSTETVPRAGGMLNAAFNAFFSQRTTMTTPAGQFPHLHNALHSTLRVKHLHRYLLQDLGELLENFAGRKVRSLADSTLVQMSSELGRQNFLISIFNWVGKRHKQNGDIDTRGEQMLIGLLSNLQTPQAFSDQKEKLEQLFADLVKHTGDVPVSTEELIQIKKALGMQASKWYRCSKGHVYTIGECGQAMQTARCIECKETVGGTSHQLVSTSTEASELNREFYNHRAAQNPFHVRF